MADFIRVTPEMLELASRKMDDAIDRYRSLYRSLYERVDALQATWQGKDHQAYMSQIQGFEGDFSRMANLMQAYSVYLKQSAKAYCETQETIANASSRLQN